MISAGLWAGRPDMFFLASSSLFPHEGMRVVVDDQTWFCAHPDHWAEKGMADHPDVLRFTEAEAEEALREDE